MAADPPPPEADTSFVHQLRMMPSLDWAQEPSSCAILISDSLRDFDDHISALRRFLEDHGLRIEMNTYVSADFIVAVGTDRFLLQMSQLFQDRPTPPILSLTPTGKGFVSFIEFLDYAAVVPQVLRGNCFLLPRCRLQIEYHTLNGIERFCVLNELSVNRDPLHRSLVLNCASGGLVFSQLWGDGVIIATPTGSTAYNKAAGGALVHPLLPVFMLTPICPLSLSARPLVFPQYAEITISIGTVPDKPREQKAVLGFDGIVHRELKVGEKLVISVAPFCLNSIVMTRSISEWLVRLAGLLNWNQRKHQKPLGMGVGA
jgi:NAD kinase